MTVPGEQFVIRRKAYAMIKKAFDEIGIKIHLPDRAITVTQPTNTRSSLRASGFPMSGQPVRRRDWFSDRAAPIRRRPGWQALDRNHQPGVFCLITRLQSDQVRLRGRQVSGPDPNETFHRRCGGDRDCLLLVVVPLATLR